MAFTPPCMSDDGNAAVFVGTLLESGNSITVCPDCLVSFALSIVESNTGLPIAELIAQANESGEYVETPPAVVGDGYAHDEPEYDEPDDDTDDEQDSESPANQ